VITISAAFLLARPESTMNVETRTLHRYIKGSGSGRMGNVEEMTEHLVVRSPAIKPSSRVIADNPDRNRGAIAANRWPFEV
jgi:hypothetical protein